MYRVFHLEYNIVLRMSSIQIKLIILKFKFVGMILHAKFTRKGNAYTPYDVYMNSHFQLFSKKYFVRKLRLFDFIRT